MTDRRPTEQPNDTTPKLPLWESGPLWALGLSNGANIALWYVLSMIGLNAPGLNMTLPSWVNGLMPLVIVAGGVAAAVSLDGVLVATLAGVRAGRSGWWSWATILGSGGFSAAIAYAVHSGTFREWAWLHMAQAGVLVLYNFHLSQPRKALHADRTAASSLPKGTNSPKRRDLEAEGYTCSRCGASGFETLAKVQTHQKSLDCVTPVTVVRQGFDEVHRNGVNHS